MDERVIEGLCLDYIILDEFYHCGAQRWSQGVNALLNRFAEEKVVGFSAAPIRYLDNNRDMAQQLFEEDGAGVGAMLAPGNNTNTKMTVERTFQLEQIGMKCMWHSVDMRQSANLHENGRRILER